MSSELSGTPQGKGKRVAIAGDAGGSGQKFKSSQTTRASKSTHILFPEDDQSETEKLEVNNAINNR